MPQPPDISARVEGILQELRAEPRVAEKAEQLVRLLMGFYGEGLEHIVQALPEEQQLRLAEDPLVASLLMLHDLHPVPLEERIQRALDGVRPYLGSHAGGVEFLGVDDSGHALLRLEGTCNGCPSSTLTVTNAIEKALEQAAPELLGVTVQGVAAPGLIQLDSLVCTVPV
ncbi:MAG: NifU family protein [Chloroflexota bacterium]|nr:NifU family protein [Chloroflexota bacterium]